MLKMVRTEKIYISGHKGMVGSAMERKLRQNGYTNIVTKNSSELDLRNQDAVLNFFKKEKPNYVILAAAKVGGIHANNVFRGEFIYDNLMIQSNIIHAAYICNVKKLLFFGSSCIYPKMSEQPIKEEYFLSGPLESTNRPYSIAKIAGIELCDAYRSQYGCNFISVMPTNLYGPNDNYHPENSHVFPALLRRIYLANKIGDPVVTIWGSGKPKREFLHVDDLADACLFLLQNYNDAGIVNIGSGEEYSIKQLAGLIAAEVGYEGEFIFDISRPDGTPRKLLDSSKLKQMGWRPSINLKNGIRDLLSDANFV
jgi:GDP-L-fucose synthase